jgi:hypothetical protein
MSGKTKSIDETHLLPPAKGGGQLRIEVWQDAKGEVIKFNLAYINHVICQVDNGRVLGYDNAHGAVHMHHMGEVIDLPLSMTNEETYDLFISGWRKYARKPKP